ncbi:putative receptor-like protein kinase [Hibiscus syriacus]|uniref:Receptor-like protein kinase n=1 Tax=Hibiscus syriacus TaxID=106335 RepID=A0A6A3A3H3_HIBSY|nr:putative receptor-like protein kinase [Hibiscus syriacus]
MHLLSTFLSISLLFFAQLPISYAQNATGIMQCCESFRCGNMSRFVFPFWKEGSPGICHNEGFELTKCDEEDDEPVIRIGADEFRLISVDQPGYRMTIARDDLWEGICPSPRIHNITLGYPFSFPPTNRNLTFFYDCDESVVPSDGVRFPCTQGSNSFYADDLVDRGSYERFSRSCHGGVIQVQINRTNFQQLNREGPEILGSGRWRLGFDVEYNFPEIFCGKCNSHKGLCDNVSSPRYPVCKKPGGGSNLNRKLLIGIVSAASGLLISGIILVCFRRNISCITTAKFLRKFTNKDQDLEAFLRNNGTLTPKRYSYSEVKKMTGSFKEELGRGGYGSVYKGKLPDNHLVAVKVLNTSKGNGQEFINEVASISRTSHVNIVTLLGFCLEGGKRALIYEFMSNGSLEKFIYGMTSGDDGRVLTVEELYRIAIGIARGLEYLHLGCNTRILHFDIKPHNILLDHEFHPKISDFGLAKLCHGTDSVVSMIEARGTIGYIAPEVFCRNIGSVSHKSDVYSYGMMILEMAGGRKNLDVGVHETSEIYFPHWIHQNLEQGNIEPELLGLLNEEETEIARKMIIVGLWCIQTNPKDRPIISKVKEMLESKEALQIPPKP